MIVLTNAPFQVTSEYGAERQLNELLFPTVFYVLDMEDEASYNPTAILLGRPFLKIAQAMINVHEWALTMELDDEIIKFNLFKAMKYPIN